MDSLAPRVGRIALDKERAEFGIIVRADSEARLAQVLAALRLLYESAPRSARRVCWNATRVECLGTPGLLTPLSDTLFVSDEHGTEAAVATELVHQSTRAWVVAWSANRGFAANVESQWRLARRAVERLFRRSALFDTTEARAALDRSERATRESTAPRGLLGLDEEALRTVFRHR